MHRKTRTHQHRRGSFDWVVDGSAWPITRHRPAPVDARANELDWSAVIERLGFTEGARRCQVSVLELAESEPRLVEPLCRVDAGRYAAVLPAGMDLSEWAARYPNFDFYAGAIAHFAAGLPSTFDWVIASASLPDVIDADPEQCYRCLSLLIGQGRLLMRDQGAGASALSVTHLQATLSRAGLRLVDRWRFADFSLSVLSRRF